MRKRWNESFPLRLAVRTGIYVAVVLFLITAGSYVSIAWILNNSANSNLLMRAHAMISQWTQKGEIQRFFWDDGYYRVVRPDGQLVLEQGSEKDLSHEKHVEQDHIPQIEAPFFKFWFEEDGKDLTGISAFLHELFPLGKGYREVYVPFKMGSEDYILELATHLEERQKPLIPILSTLISISGGGLVFIISVVAFSSREGFRPIREITRTIKTIEERTLSTRLKVPARDRTLNDLVHVINSMLDRINRAFHAQSRFVQDASHELKTPLAVLRSDIEITLRRPRTVEEYQNSLHRCLQEVEHMTRLTQQLLTLARYDQPSSFQGKIIDVQDVIQHVISLIEATIDNNQIHLEYEGQKELQVIGEPIALEVVLSNLIQNGIRAVGQEGFIRVETRQDGSWGIIDVTDNGTGIPQEAIPFLFDRFYRVDEGRNRQTGGTGLGLAICQSIVQAHHGKIEVKSEWGKGSIFSVYLPLAGHTDV